MSTLSVISLEKRKKKYTYTRKRERESRMRKAREWRQAAKRLGERNAVCICCSACKFSVFMEDLLQCISKNVQDTTRGHKMHICICSVTNEVISNAIFNISFLSQFLIRMLSLSNHPVPSIATMHTSSWREHVDERVETGSGSWRSMLQVLGQDVGPLLFYILIKPLERSSFWPPRPIMLELPGQALLFQFSLIFPLDTWSFLKFHVPYHIYKSGSMKCLFTLFLMEGS